MSDFELAMRYRDLIIIMIEYINTALTNSNDTIMRQKVDDAVTKTMKKFRDIDAGR